jgi:hypothetical protein
MVDIFNCCFLDHINPFTDAFESSFRGEKAFCRSQGIDQEALFGKRTRVISDG